MYPYIVIRCKVFIKLVLKLEKDVNVLYRDVGERLEADVASPELLYLHKSQLKLLPVLNIKPCSESKHIDDCITKHHVEDDVCGICRNEKNLVPLIVRIVDLVV